MADPIVTVDSLPVVARTYARAAGRYDEFGEIFRQVSLRMLDRLPLLAATPEVVLDLGCGSGADIPTLRKRYPRSLVIGADLAPAMLAYARRRTGRWRRASLLAADAASLPLQDGSVDLVLSNMLLPWCQQPTQVFAEIYRVLAPGGTVLFTTAGPDTLKEYRELWQQGRFHSENPERRAFGLTDMHDLGDAMLVAGFDAPVLDRENITVSYPSVTALEAELRNTGTVNVSLQRRRGLMHPSRCHWTGLQHSSDGQTQSQAGFIVTIELVQGHAWKGQLPAGRHSPDGEYQISIDSFRQGLGRSGSA